jgi:hypothetical protein
MESPNQDAMLNQTTPTYRPDTGGTAQTPDESIMINEDYNPTDLSGDAHTMPTTPTDEAEKRANSDGTGAVSDSPNMQPDTDNYGNGDALGNNDGTEPDPELSDNV